MYSIPLKIDQGTYVSRNNDSTEYTLYISFYIYILYVFYVFNINSLIINSAEELLTVNCLKSAISFSQSEIIKGSLARNVIIEEVP